MRCEDCAGVVVGFFSWVVGREVLLFCGEGGKEYGIFVIVWFFCSD